MKDISKLAWVLIMFSLSGVADSAQTLDVKKPVRSVDISFTSDRLIEVVYLSVKNHKQKQFSNEYLPKASSLLKEYGAKVLSKFSVIGKAGGDINPQTIVMIEWPSRSVKETFDRDKRYLAIKPIRDGAFSFVKFAYYQVEKDTTLTFREDKMYEFFGAWVRQQEKLDEYFKVSGPIKKTYGRPEPIFKLFLKPTDFQRENKDSYEPQMAGIVEWDNKSDYYVLTENAEFKIHAVPLFSAALSRIDMLHTKITIN